MKMEHETRVLLENMYHQVKTIAEGHSSIINKLEEHDDRFNGIDKRFDNIDAKLIAHDNKFEQMDMRFDRIETVLMDTNDRVKKIEKDHGIWQP